jgi:hypothetical protein
MAANPFGVGNRSVVLIKIDRFHPFSRKPNPSKRQEIILRHLKPVIDSRYAHISTTTIGEEYD